MPSPLPPDLDVPVSLLAGALDDYRAVADGAAPYLPLPPELVGIPMRDARVLRLDVHEDARGRLVEAHRPEWAREVVYSGSVARCVETDDRLAQVYLSTTRPGVVKGLHLHLKQRDRFVPVAGEGVLLLVDLRPGGKGGRWGACRRSLAALCAHGLDVAEIVLSAERPVRVEVPPGVAHGWLALGSSPLTILNMPSRPYDGTDERRRNPHVPPTTALSFLVVDWRDPGDG